MNHPLLAVTAAIALLAPCAQARIGETPAEIAARYGEGKKIRDRLPGAETFQYKKNTYTIEVIIYKDKSIWEIFHRDDKDITDDDIKEILKLNADSHGWRQDKKTKRWIRGDKKLEGGRQQGHPEYLDIWDVEALAAARGAKKGSVEGF